MLRYQAAQLNLDLGPPVTPEHGGNPSLTAKAMVNGNRKSAAQVPGQDWDDRQGPQASSQYLKGGAITIPNKHLCTTLICVVHKVHCSQGLRLGQARLSQPGIGAGTTLMAPMVKDEFLEAVAEHVLHYKHMFRVKVAYLKQSKHTFEDLLSQEAADHLLVQALLTFYSTYAQVSSHISSCLLSFSTKQFC